MNRVANKLKKAKISRPEIGSLVLSAIAGLYLLSFTNWTFWGKIYSYFWAYPVFIVALYVGLSSLFIAAISFFSVKYLFKPVLIFLLAVAACASWFMDSFGVIIDSDMVRNAFQTTPAEAENLITADFLWHLTLFAVVPILIVCWVRIKHRSFPQKLMWNTAAILCYLVIFGVVAFANSKTITTVVRQHKDIVKSLNPVTPVAGMVRFFTQAGAEAQIVVQQVGLDAERLPSLGDMSKPRISIVVAGETARAANFSLNGYGRNTNPELAKRDIVYFPNTKSCGTATATSLPCMFSQFPRDDYSHSKGRANENLLDVLSHADIDVQWLDNNTGDKGIAERVPSIDLFASQDSRFCVKGECLDAIFFEKIDSWLDQVTQDSVIVVHQMGSHGPAYHRRYTEDFRRFRPDCRTAELGDCTDGEILNAYDNTILYTDHILATLIDKLKARSGKFATGLIYMSDHGESLGENGLYLHGAPYLLAPSEQTHIPFLIWFDGDFARSMGLNKTCLVQDAATQSHSHDNFFHSILSMMNVATSVYDPSLDVFARCKAARTS